MLYALRQIHIFHDRPEKPALGGANENMAFVLVESNSVYTRWVRKDSQFLNCSS